MPPTKPTAKRDFLGEVSRDWSTFATHLIDRLPFKLFDKYFTFNALFDVLSLIALVVGVLTAEKKWVPYFCLGWLASVMFCLLISFYISCCVVPKQEQEKANSLPPSNPETD